MAVKVDKDLCIACGVCMALCPEVFQADAEGKSEVIQVQMRVCLVWMKQLILAQQGLSAGNSLRILVTELWIG